MMTDVKIGTQLKNNWLFNVLKEQIDTMELKPGDRLPPERQLCELYKCSRSTVRSSLKLLEERKLVERVRGSGTFVSGAEKKRITRKNIGILVPTNRDNELLKNDPYLGHIIAGLHDNLFSSYCSFSFLKMRPSESIKAFFEKHSPLLNDFDGLICLVDMMSQEEVEYLQNMEKPFVATTAAADGEQISYVGIDNRYGLYLATKHLLENGRRNLKFINGPLHQSFHRDRLKGFKKGLTEFGIDYDEKMVTIDDSAEENTVGVLTEMFDNYNTYPFDGLIVSSSWQVFVSFQVLQKKGIRIPEDVDVLLYGDLQWSQRAFRPSTPAILQPLNEQAKRLLRILINMIDKKDTATVIEILQPELVLRKATGNELFF